MRRQAAGRKYNGKWSKYKSAYSSSRSGTKYSVKIRISKTGKYKFKATTTASSKFVAATSGSSKVLTVKN